MQGSGGMRWFLILCGMVTAACTGAVPAPVFPPPNPFAPKPHYDDNTGLQGVATQPGDLAGTWGLVVEVGTIVNVPIVGDRNGGSTGLRLLTRTWNAEKNEYSETFEWCSYEIYDVEGQHTEISASTLATVTPVSFTSPVDHASGHFLTTFVINNWGWRNMPDPVDTPMPTKDNYQSPPQSDWMWDQDGDGNPGMTVHLSGLLEGQAYFISRSVYVMDGTVTSPDRISGLVRMHRNQQNTVSGSNSSFAGESRSRVDPDPKATWFDMIRMPDGSTCADVIAAGEGPDGLGKHRPF